MHRTTNSGENAIATLKTLAKKYPEKGMMDLGDPEDTLIATLLSARTRDDQVLKVYPSFRKKFPTLRDLANADVSAIASAISTIGMYKTKAKSLKKLAERVVNVYRGKIPDTMEDLTTLAGVGRKTASCELWYAFGIPAVAVDTHVFRIAHRLKWTDKKDPEKVEEDLKNLLPEKWWGETNRIFVQFGRDICRGPKPRCYLCPVAERCPFRPKTPRP